MATRPRALPTGTDLTIARHLDDVRRVRGMGQLELAAQVGVSQSQMSKLLTGARAMTMTEFLAICAALGLSPVEVLTQAESRG